MENWKVPQYSKTQIINAGKVVRHPEEHNAIEFSEARRIVDNWRASHAYPLQIIYMFLRRKFDSGDYVVARRLKRLSSIIGKLNREPNMSLWTMQDLGGCRVIVPSIDDVWAAIHEIKRSRIRHVLKKEYDYISNPKRSGYRSYHMVYKFQSDRNDTYNRNMLIEIQIRTHLQHLWATAVEAMGLITRQALKASRGDEGVLSFFKYVSSLFALEEGTEQVDGFSGTRQSLSREIRRLDDIGKYTEKLQACRVTLDTTKKNPNLKTTKGYYLLKLDYDTGMLRIGAFDNVDDATEAYNQEEANTFDEANIDVVLVSASSFFELRKAYPNYFSDIGEFVTRLRLLTSRN